MIKIFEPYLDKRKIKSFLSRSIDANWISSQGEFISKFEKKIASFHRVKYCVATSSCTTALHLAIKCLGLGEKDEIICPCLTFIAPANMIALSGAKLVLVDIDPETLTIDYKKIEKNITKKTKAIMVVHQFGHAAHMDEIQKIAKKYKLKIIEDNAESIGGRYKKKLLGTIGDVATLSFFANKILTTGEGGAILTNNKSLANNCRVLRDHGMSKKIRYKHIQLGYNYRMTNLQAAVGYSQINNLKKILKIRNIQKIFYEKNLKNIKQIKLRKFKNWTKPVHWLMTISLEKESIKKKLITFLKSKKIDSRPMIFPVTEGNHFKKYYNKKNFPNSYVASSLSLHLPSSTGLKEKEIKYICDQIKIFIKKNYKNNIN
jgi:perosamine synthetase